MPYLILYLFVTFASLLNENRKLKKLIMPLTLITILIFFGMRGFVFSDWVHYKINYDKIENIREIIFLRQNKNFLSMDYDLGYKYYTSFIKLFTNNYHVFIFVNSLINLLLVYLTFKRYLKNVLYGFIIFIAFNGLIIEFDLIRNARAIFLFMYSLRFIEERKFLKYILINLLGLMFHHTALFYFPLYFILNKKYSKKFIISLFLFMSFYYFYHIGILKIILLKILGIFQFKYSYKLIFYLNTEYWSQIEKINILKYGERLISFSIIVFYMDRFLKLDNKRIVVINLMYLYIFIYLFTWEISVIAERILPLIVCSYWLFYSMLIELFSNKLRAIVLFLCFIYFGLNLCQQFIFVKDSYRKEILRYENIIFKFDSYEEKLLKINTI